MADKKKKVRSVKDTPRHKVGVVLGTGFFVILCAIIVFPVFAGLLASFRPGKELIRRGLSIDLDFSTMSLDNYTYLFSGNADSQKYFMWYKNLKRHHHCSNYQKEQEVLKPVIVHCQSISYKVTDEKRKHHRYNSDNKRVLIDSYVGVIITGLCSASTIFFFKQYLSGLPKDLLDAARIDGATEYGIATKIILPLTKPAFASMGILSAMGVWNAILWPLLVLKGAEKFTLPIGLNTLLTPYGNNYDVLIAGSMFGILPIFIIFLIFQKYIIDGMTAGAVKG